MSRARYPSITHPCAGRVSPYCYGSFSPRDLHVLATPPAFVLSQDQTLQSLIRINPPRRAGGIVHEGSNIPKIRRLRECLIQHTYWIPTRPNQPSDSPERVTFPHASNCSLFKDRTAGPNLVAEGRMMPTSGQQVKTFLTFLLFSFRQRQRTVRKKRTHPARRAGRLRCFTCQVVLGPIKTSDRLVLPASWCRRSVTAAGCQGVKCLTASSPTQPHHTSLSNTASSSKSIIYPVFAPCQETILIGIFLPFL